VLWLGLLLAAWLMPAVSPLAILVNFALLLSALAARSAARLGAWGSWIAFLEPRARGAACRDGPGSGTTLRGLGPLAARFAGRRKWEGKSLPHPRTRTRNPWCA
jgi:hypothetical protein